MVHLNTRQCGQFLRQQVFQQLKKQMKQVVALIAESIWWYGNIYDAKGKPINWW